MQERLTKVEIYGQLTEMPSPDTLEHKRQVELYVRKNVKEGTKTFIFTCVPTGKILLKFDVLLKKGE